MNGLFYLITLACAILLFVIAVARLNDMGRTTHNDWHWWLRRAGMIIVALSSALAAAAPAYGHRVTLVEVSMILGVTFCWITTPNQPPLWRFIFKGETGPHNRRKTDAPNH